MTELEIQQIIFEIKGDTIQERMDSLQRKIMEMPQVDCPLSHRFTDNQYIREIFMPKGAFVISKIHNTEHPYFVMKGKVSVFTENEGEVIIEAPFYGITEPGTRRTLYVHEDTVWATYHPLDFVGETIEEIENRIIEKRDISLTLESNPLSIKNTLCLG